MREIFNNNERKTLLALLTRLWRETDNETLRRHALGIIAHILTKLPRLW